MVTAGVRLLLLCALLSGTSQLRAEDRCIQATEFEPRLCPAELPALRSLRIEKQGQSSGGVDPYDSDCRRFRLSEEAVRRYFKRAMRVPVEEGEHAIDRGPCWASGTVRFANGTRATWRIEQVGTATLEFGSTQERITLYCTRCRFRPFVF